jgi:hypothetical protein
LVRVGDAPAHHHHQIESKGQEGQGRDPILEADHLVISGKDPFPDESRFVMMVFVVGVVPGV